MTNTVIYWKGGGYDGCIWEPNMGFFDGDGKWHPVISTGCGALDTKEDVEAEMKKQEDPNVKDWEKNDLLTFPIEGEHPLEWMCEHVRIDYVAVLADALVEAGYSVDMKCDCCGEWFSSDDYEFRDIVGIMSDSGFYKGDGGIGVIVTDIWCDDCRRNAECPACYEINLPPPNKLKDEAYRKELEYATRFALDELGICEYCWDRFQRAHDGWYNRATQEWEFEKKPEEMVRLPNESKIGTILEHLEESQERKTERWDSEILATMRKLAKWQADEGMSRVDIEAQLIRQLAAVPAEFDGPNLLMEVPSKFAYGVVRNLIVPIALKYFDYELDHIEFEPTDLTEFWKEVFNG